MNVHVEVEVNPTESEEKVRKAVREIFGDMHFEVKELHRIAVIIGEAHGEEALSQFCGLLRRERIRDAAKKVLLEGVDRNSVTFCLNKQVAYVGHLSFSKESAESPLGPIRVKITSENPREIVKWLTAKESRD